MNITLNYVDVSIEGDYYQVHFDAIDLGKDGKLISMTIEHAKEQATIKEFSYLEIEKVIA